MPHQVRLGPYAGGSYPDLGWASSSTTGVCLMASPGINFESIEALWAKALALDLETDPVDLDASPSADLAAFSPLRTEPRPLFWPSPPIASATYGPMAGLKKGCHTQKSCYTVGFGLGFWLCLWTWSGPGWTTNPQNFGGQQKTLRGYGWAEKLEPKTEEGQKFWAAQTKDLEVFGAQEAQNHWEELYQQIKQQNPEHWKPWALEKASVPLFSDRLCTPSKVVSWPWCEQNGGLCTWSSSTDDLS